MAEFGTLVCDDYGARCDCCGRIVRRVKANYWSCGHRFCFACFCIWYDEGRVDPAEIKARVLAAEATGKWPFPARPGDGHERVEG